MLGSAIRWDLISAKRQRLVYVWRRCKHELTSLEFISKVHWSDDQIGHFSFSFRRFCSKKLSWNTSIYEWLLFLIKLSLWWQQWRRRQCGRLRSHLERSPLHCWGFAGGVSASGGSACWTHTQRVGVRRSECLSCQASTWIVLRLDEGENLWLIFHPHWSLDHTKFESLFEIGTMW